MDGESVSYGEMVMPPGRGQADEDAMPNSLRDPDHHPQWAEMPMPFNCGI